MYYILYYIISYYTIYVCTCVYVYIYIYIYSGGLGGPRWHTPPGRDGLQQINDDNYHNETNMLITIIILIV